MHHSIIIQPTHFYFTWPAGFAKSNDFCKHETAMLCINTKTCNSHRANFPFCSYLHYNNFYDITPISFPFHPAFQSNGLAPGAYWASWVWLLVLLSGLLPDPNLYWLINNNRIPNPVQLLSNRTEPHVWTKFNGVCFVSFVVQLN